MVSMESFSHTGDQKRKKNFMVKTLKLFRSHLQKEFLCAGEIMKLMRRSFYWSHWQEENFLIKYSKLPASEGGVMIGLC